MIGIKTEKTTTIKFSQISVVKDAVGGHWIYALDRFGDIWTKSVWGNDTEWHRVASPKVLDTEPNF